MVAVVAAMAAEVEVAVVGKVVAAVEEAGEMAVPVAINFVLLVSSFFKINYSVLSEAN